MPPEFKDWRTTKEIFENVGMPFIFEGDIKGLLDLVEKYEKALHEILNLRDSLEYVDEWQEAACYELSENIARKALRKD